MNVLSIREMYDLTSFLCLKDQNSRHFEEHRETDDMSEMSPNKNLKSPQKGSKRLKTTPFKVTLLDAAVFEGEIEVCMMYKQTIKFIAFNSLNFLCSCFSLWEVLSIL